MERELTEKEKELIELINQLNEESVEIVNQFVDEIISKKEEQ